MRISIILSAMLVVLATETARAQSIQDPPVGPPDAVVDLRTRKGVDLLEGKWRYSDTRIVEIDYKGPGADLKPSGKPIKTYDYQPKAGPSDYDDSKWEVVDPTTLDARRSTGKVCFNWYRIKLKVPQRIGNFDPTGATVAFEVVIDDYAEVWVNGQLPIVLGQTGGQVVKGFNAPNRVIVGRDVRPGDEIQLAVFGINGPISRSPDNFIWIKSATLDFYQPKPPTYEANARIERLDPALDEIVAAKAGIEKIATGFIFTEGPVWVRDGGYLLFSDPNNNTIYRWAPDAGVSIYRTKSGYSGFDIGEYTQPGSNGLTLDKQGRVTIDEMGNRRVTRLEKNGQVTVLADSYMGKHLNSPNDLVYRSDGTLYFSDPPFGLPKVFDDRRKELPFSSVFRISNGEVIPVTQELSGPNGVVFSPDEKYLYVDNWDLKKSVIMRYPISPDGNAGKGDVFVDATGAPGEDAWDGMKVDRRGNLYASGPGGLWIISPSGKHLGTIIPPEHPHNLAWGDADLKTLYMTSRGSVYRIHLNIPGIAP